MKFQIEMMYLGSVTQESKKSGKTYMLAKFMNTEDQSIFEFYVSGDRIDLITKVAQLKPFAPAAVTCKLISFNNKPDVLLSDIEQ